MKRLYLVLAIVGAVVPYVFLFLFFDENGFALGGFLQGIVANHAATMFTVDLVISSAVFWLFMSSRRGPKPTLFIVLNLTIGLSCALPAYLYASESKTVS